MGRVICKIAETETERQGHFAVRQAVFVDEQGLFTDSDIDHFDRAAVPLIAVDRDSGAIVGAVRCYETEPGVWYGGRLAVLKAARHDTSAVGPRLCKLAEKVVIERGCHRFLAYIQLQNVRFFERLGWRCVGEPVEHFGQPHQLMQASLAAAKKIRKIPEPQAVEPMYA
ncbi:MAG: GNAT family N-acetyltransferase [Anaerolineae bacterium]|nr:GNAT family N-acetyltransferase [Anaerolineae bacterium]